MAAFSTAGSVAVSTSVAKVGTVVDVAACVSFIRTPLGPKGATGRGEMFHWHEKQVSRMGSLADAREGERVESRERERGIEAERPYSNIEKSKDSSFTHCVGDSLLILSLSSVLRCRAQD